MKTLNIEIPNGYEIDREKSTFEKIVFKEIKKSLPTKWEELRDLGGSYVMLNSGIGTIKGAKNTPENKHIFKTEEQAKASIALAQLSQLIDVYRQGWVPDWKHKTDKKFAINFDGDKPYIDGWYNHNSFLSFQNEEIAREFLDNFRDLIMQARPLMS